MRQARRRKGLDEDDPQNPVLGAKIRHLIGVYGYRFGVAHIRDNRIAEYLKVDPATWARIKNGTLKPGVERLGALIEYFHLDSEYQLTYEIFLLPTLEDFKRVLKEKAVGSYGAGGIDAIKAKLSSSLNVKSNGISIERSAATRPGGLGGVAPRGEYPTVRAGEHVTLRILHPEGGHLLLLNDGPDKKFVCLMPSLLAPDMAVSGRVTRVPTDESPSPVFVINPPAGRYRLYSVWTQTPVELDFLGDAVTVDDEFLTVPLAGLRQLAGLITHFDGQITDRKIEAPYEIRIADYDVID